MYIYSSLFQYKHYCLKKTKKLLKNFRKRGVAQWQMGMDDILSLIPAHKNK